MADRGAHPTGRASWVDDLRAPSRANARVAVPTPIPREDIDPTQPETLQLGEAGAKANQSSGTTFQLAPNVAPNAAIEPPAQDSRLAGAPAQNDAMGGPLGPFPGGPELQIASPGEAPSTASDRPSGAIQTMPMLYHWVP